jgi:ATP-dependent Clp protease adapter protein ClpS
MPSNENNGNVGTITVHEKQEKQAHQPQRPHIVVIHNDDEHSAEFVIGVLMEVCKMTVAQAVEVTKEIHTKGRGIAYRGMKEHCELKEEQIRTFRDKAAQELAGAPNTELCVTVEQE